MSGMGARGLSRFVRAVYIRAMIWGLIFFILVAGALTAAVVALLVMALLRGRAAGGGGTDVAVYRDQLAEIDRDLARGVLEADEAERVRIEISRRLLAADQAQGQADDAIYGSSRIIAIALATGVFVGAGGLYLTIGAAGLRDQPLALRVSEADTAIAGRPSQAEFEATTPRPWAPAPDADPEFLELMDKLRAAVAQNPDDLQGQVLLARNEMLQGNFRAAHPAAAAIIRLKGDQADLRDRLAYIELLVAAVDGYVSPEAEAVANEILEIEPRDGTARYYLGLKELQGGRADKALEIWAGLLAESTSQAPWVPPILGQIEDVAAAAGARYQIPPRFAAPASNLPGPSAEEMQAASEMEAGDRQAMIQGMVEGLAERLATEGGSAEEWARLVRALGVLGQRDRAAGIWAEAQEVFAEDPDGLNLIRTAATDAGVVQ